MGHRESNEMLKEGGRTLRLGLPWLPRLEQILRECSTFAATEGQYILASDYSGHHKTSSHFVYSFSLLDANLGPWMRLRNTLRQNYLNDSRRISFKGMNDARQRAALNPFLEAAEWLRGCIVSVAFDKRMEALRPTKSLLSSGLLAGNWKVAPAHDMFIKALIASSILGRWVPRGADIYWLSDRDSSLANDALADDMHMTTANLYNLLTFENQNSVTTGSPEFFLGTPEAWIEPLVAEDLIALSDLSAGMVAEMVSSIYQTYPSRLLSKMGVVMQDFELNRKVDIISDWYWHRSSSFEKTCVVADVHDKKVHMYRLDTM